MASADDDLRYDDTHGKVKKHIYLRNSDTNNIHRVSIHGYRHASAMFYAIGSSHGFLYLPIISERIIHR